MAAKVYLFQMNDEGDIVAAHSRNEAIQFYYKTGLLVDEHGVRQLTDKDVRMLHRVLSASRDSWFTIPTGSKEVFIDALGRDLINGVSVPYLFATSDY